MMNIRPIAILGITFCGQLWAQTTTSDCDGAIQLCGGIYTESSAPTGTGNVYEFTGTCNLNLESASLWYTFTVQDAGNLSFILDPANDFDDYDWGLFNITNGGCAGINAQDGTSPEVQCNSYGTFFGNGQTGISTAEGGVGSTNGPGDLNGPPFNADMPVVVGQTYALVVMNWTGSTDGYNIDFTQSTASIYDEDAPTIVSITADCTNQNFQLVFSEPIVSSTVSATDFTLTSPSGVVLPISTVTPDNTSANAQTGYTVTLGSVPGEGGMYTFTVTFASGNVEDLCGNVVVDTTFTLPIVAPLVYDLDISTACNGTGGSIQATYISGGNQPISFYLDGSMIPGGSATGLEPGTYGFTVVDSIDCQTLEMLTVPDHSIDLSIPQEQDSLSCSNAVVTIEGVQVDPDQVVLYLWTALTTNGFDTAYSTISAPEVTEAGVYTLLVTDPGSGCTDVDSVMITQTSASILDLSSVMLPNVVSPNGDGNNDVWRPFLPAAPNMDITHLFETYKLTIFNSWGQPVYETVSNGSGAWNARDVVDGTYFYTVAYRSDCGTVVDKQINGSITVVR